jgi:ABC-2 type transport system ATP-binding protein
MKVELQHVVKHFGRLAALDDLSLTIDPGRRVALIGPNGSGKSTLTRVLMGILDCEGVIRLDERDPRRERLALARQISYVPQVAPQLGASVDEVLRSIGRIRRLPPDRVHDLARRLGLDIGRIGSKSFRALSGGMKQKLLIALALAPEASLLILDEPTASLDAAARQVFYELIGERAGRSTLLLCSHRLEEVRHLVDHVIGLHNGQVAYDGPVGDYLSSRSHGVIEIYLNGPTHEAWLRACGFRAGAGRGWARAVTHEEKLPLIRQLTSVLNGELANLVVRDLDLIEDPVGPEAAADVNAWAGGRTWEREGLA